MVREVFGLAAGGDVGEAGFVGEGGDEGVAAGGEFGGHALFGGGEAGEDEQAAFGQRGLPFCGNAFWHGAGRADDDRLRAAQKDAQAFLLHGRMETANDAAPIIPPTGGLVVGGQNDVAGTAGGTKERGFGQGQQTQISQGSQGGGSSRAQPLTQGRGVAGIGDLEHAGIHGGSGFPQHFQMLSVEEFF